MYTHEIKILKSIKYIKITVFKIRNKLQSTNKKVSKTSIANAVHCHT